MGGLATAVAAGLVSIMLLQCFTVFMGASLAASSDQMGAANDQAALLSASLGERALVQSVQVVNQTCVLVTVQNAGTSALQVGSLPQVDLILVYGLASTNGTGYALWVPYAGSPSSMGWAVTSVTTSGGGAPQLDPTNAPYPTYGAWEPSELMDLRVTLPPAEAIDTNASLAVVFATPVGTTSTASD